MNPNDDQKPIIEETPPTSGPPLDPDQEEKYKKILDEYTKNLQPSDLTPQQPPTQTLINQPEHDLQSQPEEPEQSIQDDNPSLYDAPKPSDYIPPTPEPSPAPEEFSHQLPPQYQPPQETSVQPDLSSTDITPPSVTPPPPITSPTSPDDVPLPPKKSNFFKYLFILSTLVFVVIVALLVKDYLKLQQLTQDTPLVKPVVEMEPTTVPVSNDQKCLVNEVYLSIGQSFPAEDECNSCQCQLVDDQPQVICSTNDCGTINESTPSAIPTEKDYLDSLE